MRTVKPLGSKILVRQVDSGVSKGNIIIPDSAQQGLKEAVVISTGPGYRLLGREHGGKLGGHLDPALESFFSPLQVGKGDRILYDDDVQKHHIDLPDGGGRFIIMDENAILAKLEEIPNE